MKPEGLAAAGLLVVGLCHCSGPAVEASRPATSGSPRPTPVPGTLPLEAREQLPAHVELTSDGEAAVPFERAHIDEASPAAMWTMAIADGKTARLAAEMGRTLYGVVTRGRVALSDRLLEPERTVPPEMLPTWHAFRAPGVAVELRAAEGPAQLVLAMVSSEGPLRSTAGPASTTRPAPVDTIDFGARADLAFANHSSHIRIGFEDGAASLQLMVTSADAPVPLHDHPASWEVIGLLRARGVFRQGPALRNTEGPAALHIRPQTTHGWAPEGDTPLLAVQLYIPPGPEQRFKQLAKQ